MNCGQKVASQEAPRGQKYSVSQIFAKRSISGLSEDQSTKRCEGFSQFSIFWNIRDVLRKRTLREKNILNIKISRHRFDRHYSSNVFAKCYVNRSNLHTLFIRSKSTYFAQNQVRVLAWERFQTTHAFSAGPLDVNYN